MRQQLGDDACRSARPRAASAPSTSKVMRRIERSRDGVDDGDARPGVERADAARRRRRAARRSRCRSRRCSGARATRRRANSIASAMGTSGAPCPPAATSRTRKSLTTSMPVRSAITADSPSCQVECGGSCQIVCPCDPIARTSLRGTPASARTAIAASASQSPRSNARRQYSCAVPRSGSAAAAARAARRCTADDEREQLGVDAVSFASSAETNDGRRDAVERRARHESDEDAQAGCREPAAERARRRGGSRRPRVASARSASSRRRRGSA